MANQFREKLSNKRSKKGYEAIAKRNKLLQLLADIPDHRKGQGKLHKLEHILFLSVIAQLSSFTTLYHFKSNMLKHIW